MSWQHIRQGEGIELHLFLTSALDGGGWLTSHPGHLTPGKELQDPLKRPLNGPQC